jgi:DNA-nicking Smr family endonuclease
VKKKPFHAPFEKLSGLHRAPARPAAAPRKPATPPAPPPPMTEEALWARATAGARPVAAGPDLVAPRSPRRPGDRAWYAELDAVDDLPTPVGGAPGFELTSGATLLEGAVSGLDAGVVRRLKRGDYAVEGRLDLHGLTREAAGAAVERFLRASRLGGKRCVLVIHGRGRHSEAQLPVIKAALQEWLAAGRFGRQVLAVASARPADGGGGALYVLLRRPGR